MQALAGLGEGGDWESPAGGLRHLRGHEQHVTALIHNLYGLAVKEADYASQIFLSWFITEQVEEEKNASTILEDRLTSSAPGG